MPFRVNNNDNQAIAFLAEVGGQPVLVEANAQNVEVNIDNNRPNILIFRGNRYDIDDPNVNFGNFLYDLAYIEDQDVVTFNTDNFAAEVGYVRHQG